MSREYRRKRKLFDTKLKEVQQAHRPSKIEARNHYNWKKEWGPFIKYDADWDGDYLLDLIIYKLEKMYLELDIFSNEVREDLDKKLSVLKQTIDLGKKIQTFDYDEESQKFSEEHVTHYIFIYKHTNIDYLSHGNSRLPLYRNEELLYKMPRPKMSLEEEVEYEIKTRDWSGSKTAMKWATDQGYDPKDIHLAYGADWDDMKNHGEWLKIMDKEAKTKQADIDKFFKLIAKNYRKWWW